MSRKIAADAEPTYPVVPPRLRPRARVSMGPIDPSIPPQQRQPVAPFLSIAGRTTERAPRILIQIFRRKDRRCSILLSLPQSTLRSRRYRPPPFGGESSGGLGFR